MICSFFQLPLQLGATTPSAGNIINGTASTAAAEVTNTIEWLVLNG
jgi:hypothetical protein